MHRTLTITMTLCCALSACSAQPAAHETPRTPAAVDAEPAEPGVRSWRRVYPGGDAGDRLTDLLALVRDERTINDVVDASFFEHTPREALEMNLRAIRKEAGGALEFVRVLRLQGNTLGVELADTEGDPWGAAIIFNDEGRLTALDLKAQRRADDAKVYDTWDEVERDVAALDAGLSMGVWRLDERGVFTPLVTRSESETLNIGQLAHLFTLGAAAQVVEFGILSWERPVSIEPRFVSLPPSQYMNAPAGSEYELGEITVGAGTLRDSAAADALFHTVGRDRVAEYYRSMVADAPEHAMPYLSMREFALLKLFSSDEGRERYAASDAEARRATLAGVPEDADLSVQQAERLAEWTGPRSIDRIGWFASAEDLSRTLNDLRAYASETTGMLPIARALRSTPDVPLVADAWPVGVVKSGGEPGVYATAWLLQRYDGAWFVSVLIMNDSDANPDAPEGARIMRGVADLLAITD